MNKPVIVALDVDNRTQLDELLEILGKSQDVNIKIGMELFFNQGEV